MENLLWNEALNRLQQGNNRFVNDRLENKNRDANARKDSTTGQHPYAVILSCADSRVVPELAFDTGLGELFVIRVAGNVANTSTVASIEYAVAHLYVNLIVVMGHENCGAVTAALQGGQSGSANLDSLLSHIQPAVKICGHSSPVNEVVKTNAQLTAEALSTKSAIIKKEIEAGKLRVFPAYYNLGTGKVNFNNNTTESVEIA